MTKQLVNQIEVANLYFLPVSVRSSTIGCLHPSQFSPIDPLLLIVAVGWEGIIGCLAQV